MYKWMTKRLLFFFFQAGDGIRDVAVTGVQTCALPISGRGGEARRGGDGVLVPQAHAGPVPRGRRVERKSRGDERAVRARQEDARRTARRISPPVRLQRR